MEAIAVVGVVVAGIVVLFFRARRDVTVCTLDVRGGKIRVTSGGLSPAVLADLADVALRPPIGAATLRIVRDDGRARLEIAGDVAPAQAQQLRNVVGSRPLAMLRRAPPRRRSGG